MNGLRQLKQNPVLRRAVVRHRHRGIDESDSCLASYPKSGNTWLKFMLAQLLTGDEVDFDSVEVVVPNVGSQRGAPRLLPAGGRLVKSHEPFSALALRFGRAVYIVRDGRDVAVSYYFHQLRRGEPVGPFSEFLLDFLAGHADGYGGWGEHVRSWLGSPLAGDGRLHVIRYEDVLADPEAALREAIAFLGISVDAERIAAVVAANAAGEMRAKEARSAHLAAEGRRAVPFVREAGAGGWARHFALRDVHRFEAAYGTELDLLGYFDAGAHEAYA